MRISKFHIGCLRFLIERYPLILCLGFWLVAPTSFGQDGFFSGVGLVEVSSGLDGNVWRMPVGMSDPAKKPTQDVFTRLEGRWKNEVAHGKSHWTVSASGYAKRQAIQSDANAHQLDFGAGLIHQMNARVRGELGLALSQRKELEVNWADREQWQMMSHMDVHSFGIMYFDVNPHLHSEVGVAWNRSMYQASSPSYGNQLFQLHAEWRWDLFRRARGLRRFNLVNPKRTKDAGALKMRTQFSQRNFNDWCVGEGFGIVPVNPLDFKFRAEQSGLMPQRVWVDWEVHARYASASRFGWDFFMDVTWNRRYDESLGDFGRKTWTMGGGLFCRSHFLKLEMGLYKGGESYENRLAWTDRGLESLQYRLTSWRLDAEIPTVRGWSYVVRGGGLMRQSNREGASLIHRNSMGHLQVLFGIRWHLGYSRFLAS